MNEIAPMAYTGAAAIVMRTKGLITAKTAHSSLYVPVEEYQYDDNNNIIMDTYLNKPKYKIAFKPKPLDDIKLIVVDEAPQVPKTISNEIMSRGIKVLAAGDLDQLPPITSHPGFLCEGKIYRLTEHMRQLEGSDILYLADRALKGLPIHNGIYGNCYVIYEDELTENMIRRADMILCGKNSTRDYFNRSIRKNIYHIQENRPVYNEKMICRKNNWDLDVDGINLANGLIGRVHNIPSIEDFNGKTFRIDFKPSMINSYFKNLECDYQYLVAPYNIKKKLKASKYSRGEKMEFANAITTHLSQGNEFNRGIYYAEYLHKDIQKNLMYTAITRFKKSIIIVKPCKKWYF